MMKVGRGMGPGGGLADWIPIVWDTVSGAGTLAFPGNGAVKKTAGGATAWDNGAWTALTFATFPIQLRVKFSNLVVGSFGFADNAGNNLAIDGSQFSEKWSLGNYEPATSHISQIEDPAGFANVGVDNDTAKYLYVKVSAAGAVTAWQDTVLIYTYVGSAAGKTLIPFGCQYDTTNTAFITESAYLRG